MTVRPFPTAVAAEPSAWLESAAALLAEPDPGPTPMLVDDLIVESAIGALQGAPKAGKTWLELDLAVSIVTGEPALGRHTVANPGPVVIVLEESGRAALHRRLAALIRGRDIPADRLGDLHFAANQRVRLDAPDWQQRLRAAIPQIKPRAVFFDPLARLKDPSRDENEQTAMAPLLDFMRELRDLGDCAVVFAHHTGHGGAHLRGTSDLESYWETKLTLTRDSDGICKLDASHREALGLDEPIGYRLAWHDDNRSMRLEIADTPIGVGRPARTGTEAEQIAAWITRHDRPQTVTVITSALGISETLLKRRRPELEALGITYGPVPGRGRSHAYGTTAQWINAHGQHPSFTRHPSTRHATGNDYDGYETPENTGNDTRRNSEPVEANTTGSETPATTGENAYPSKSTPYGGTDHLTGRRPNSAPTPDTGDNR